MKKITQKTQDVIDCITDRSEEAGLDPVTCPPDRLRFAIVRCAARASAGDATAKTRCAFLMGVEHARIVIAAATGGRIA